MYPKLNPATSFFLELLIIALHSSPVAYWTPSNLGGSSFSVISFCLFHTVHVHEVLVARILESFACGQSHLGPVPDISTPITVAAGVTDRQTDQGQDRQTRAKSHLAVSPEQTKLHHNRVDHAGHTWSTPGVLGFGPRGHPLHKDTVLRTGHVANTPSM